MATGDLSKLSRKELLELLIEQGKEIERLRSELDSVRSSLDDKTIELTKAGTMAQAAIGVNRVFEAADEAASQYLDNIRRLCEDKQKDYDAAIFEATEKAKKIIGEAEQERARRIKDANAYWKMVYERAEELMKNAGAGSDKK